MKALQKKFVITAMIAFTAVALTVILVINVSYGVIARRNQMDILNGIHEYNEMTESQSEQSRTPINTMPWAGGPDSEFMMRFFTVTCDSDGIVEFFNEDYISSIDLETAQEYTYNVLDRQKETGTYGDYRYLVSENSDNETMEVIYLNISDARASSQRLLAISVATGAASLLLVLMLLILLSRKAVAPYARNIEQQKRFITDAGHELKTPITSIAASADILEMENEGNEWVANIRKQTARLSKLVSELVTLSRFDEEAPLSNTETFSLSEAAWEISETFNVRASSKDLTYEQYIDDGIIFTGDRAAILQMLSILLDNAFRYSDTPGIVRIKLQKDQNHTVFSVYNTCASLEGVDLNRLFDRFYRPDASRSTETGGNGIGLSIARAIAEKHGGRITASSEDMTSIIFRVVL